MPDALGGFRKRRFCARLSHSAYGSFLASFAPSGLTGKARSGSI
jgi:hypothetical protein